MVPTRSKNIPVSPSIFEPAFAPHHEDHLPSQDVTRLLNLMGELVRLRNDARTWRLELLTSLVRLLSATATAAFIARIGPDHRPPQIVSIFDVGFKDPVHREAFLDEFNTEPFRDLLSQAALHALRRETGATFTAARRDLVNDLAWYASDNVLRYRRAAQLDDCLLSIQFRGNDQSDDFGQPTAMFLSAFRPWDAPKRFSRRDRLLLDTLHAGLDWLYRSEEASHRLTRASALAPRLRQTLDLLLTGDTERQVARKMALSVHTVHDYVKALYAHFGVSSRNELLARWVQSGGQLPPPSQVSF